MVDIKLKVWLVMKTLEKTSELALIIFISSDSIKSIIDKITSKITFNTELFLTPQEMAIKLFSKVMLSKAWLATRTSVKMLESVLIKYTTEELDIEIDFTNR